MVERKRQDFPSGLWIVATPIGNLADLSERARDALERAEVILCEDTRRTSQLLSALGISRKATERLDAHASPAKVAGVVKRLVSGVNMALVSDAGTPSISDPGSALVGRAREAGVRVTPIPGPSAIAALLSACGFEETAFTFRGFFPRQPEAQRKELASAAASEVSRVFVWFESPQRIVGTLELIAGSFPQSELVVAKELSKIHERFFHGKSARAFEEVAGEIRKEGAHGEWSLAVLFAEPETGPEPEQEASWPRDEVLAKVFDCLLGAGVPASGAAKAVSQHFGISRNDAYERAIRKKDQRGT